MAELLPVWVSVTFLSGSSFTSITLRPNCYYLVNSLVARHGEREKSAQSRMIELEAVVSTRTTY
jgi:hypothetical protein